jgi:hypothetical protein
MQYIARGHAWGNYWGGGQGGYKAVTITADSMKELEQSILDGISDGSLDSGMGYESLVGAYMTVETIDTITKDGKEYTHSDYESRVYGDLSEEIIDILAQA